MVYGNFTSYAAVRGFTPEMVSMNMQNVFFKHWNSNKIKHSNNDMLH